MAVRIVGARLKALREHRDLTQGQLAYKAGTTSAQISRLENDERPGAQAVVVGRIAEALNTSTDFLLGRTDDPSPPSPPDPQRLEAFYEAAEMLASLPDGPIRDEAMAAIQAIAESARRRAVVQEEERERETA